MSVFLNPAMGRRPRGRRGGRTRGASSRVTGRGCAVRRPAVSATTSTRPSRRWFPASGSSRCSSTGEGCSRPSPTSSPLPNTARESRRQMAGGRPMQSRTLCKEIPCPCWDAEPATPLTGLTYRARTGVHPWGGILPPPGGSDPRTVLPGAMAAPTPSARWGNPGVHPGEDVIPVRGLRRRRVPPRSARGCTRRRRWRRARSRPRASRTSRWHGRCRPRRRPRSSPSRR